MSTPCVDGDRVYGLGKDGMVLCLRTVTGNRSGRSRSRTISAYPRLEHGWASSPVVDGRLLLLSAGFAGLALDKMTGELVWESSPTERIDQLAEAGGAGYYATPVLCNFEGKRCGLFYGQTRLSAVDLASGQREWTFAHYRDAPDRRADGLRAPGSFSSRSSTPRCSRWRPAPPKTAGRCNSLTTGANGAVMVDGFVYGSHNGQLRFPDLALGHVWRRQPFRSGAWSSRRGRSCGIQTRRCSSPRPALRPES